MKKLWLPLVIVVVLVGTYLVLSATYDAKAKTVAAAWKAAGHPATLEELEAAFDTGSESTAAVVRQAADMLSNEDRKRLAELDSVGYDRVPGDVDVLLAAKSQLYELVMQIAAMPPADFGTNVRDGIAARIFDRLVSFPAFRQLLRLQAQSLAAGGRPDSALKALSASVALSGMFAEPMAIYCLVSLSDLDSASASIARIAPKAGTPAVEALIAQLEKPDFKDALHRAVECEMAMTSYSLKDGSISQLAGVTKLAAALIKTARPLRGYTEARVMALAREELKVLPKPWYAGHAELARLDSTARGKDILSQLAGVAAPRLELFYARTERATALCDITVLGLKALVLKKQQGKLPADMTALAADAPKDRYSGKPYGYQATADGFAVYSVGPDGKDDGGDPAKDLVFSVRL